MKSNLNRHITLNMALVMAVALILPMGLTSSLAFAGDKHKADRVEVRIEEMRDKLKITPAQEEQWTKVEQTMREDAKVMDRLTQARFDQAKDMTAIDDLKSYGEIAAAHAEGIKKLTPVFAALYDTMSDAQKKDADVLFRHGAHEHGGHQHGHKAPADKS